MKDSQKYNRKNEKLFLRCNEMMKEYEAASDEYVEKKENKQKPQKQEMRHKIDEWMGIKKKKASNDMLIKGRETQQFVFINNDVHFHLSHRWMLNWI